MLNERLIKWLSRRVPEQGTNIATALPIILATDQGLSRVENQDRVAAMRVNAISGGSKPFVAIALADGMGGMKDGAGCAIRALSSFFNALAHHRNASPKERLELAVHSANNSVNAFSGGYGGATLSALLICPDEDSLLANIGDSRIYAISGEDIENNVERLTVDDSLEEAVGGYGRELLQFVGMGDGLKPHVSVVPKEAKRILITSDGVHFISQSTLYDVLLNAPESKQVADRLGALVRWCGAPDNASLAIADLPALGKSLNLTGETGIELWDPFGALNVIWLKQEPFVDNISMTLPTKAATKPKPNKPQKNIKLSRDSSVRATTSKKPRKPRIIIVKAKDKTADIPFLEFELNTESPKK